MEWEKIADPETLLAAVPVEEIWGISGRLGARLRKLGIADALALRSSDPKRLRQPFGVVMERMDLELRGVS